MEFIDHTGHIFSLPSYKTNPVGYQWDINKYVFWTDNPDNTHKLSVNQWYVKSIRVLTNNKEHNIENVEVSIHQSSIFSLISHHTIQDKIEKLTSIYDNIEMRSSEFVSSLDEDDFVQVPLNEYTMIPFYVIGKSKEEGSFMTNILIHITYDDFTEDWCPITVGGEWYEETEPLVINAHNMGINLPKDILKAVYDCSYYSDVFDEVEWNEKMKELLLSYMHIKGECGNYKSAIDSLRWFGYGDKIEISSLLRTDNQFLAQYILDQFSLDSDILQSYKIFKHSALISLYMKCNEESDKEDLHKWDEEFFGEGKPFTEDLFHKLVPVYYDEEDIPFWKPYYDWTFDEMALKLAILKDMYQRYFLPMHLSIKTASFKHTVFVNDNKLTIGSSLKRSEAPVLAQSDATNVKFGGNLVYIFNQVHYFDTCYNSISNYPKLGTETDEEILYINDVCAEIPIHFLSSEDEQVFNCHLILIRERKKVYESDFSFIQKKGEQRYESFILIPKQLNYSKDINYWIDKNYRIALLCNGKWYYHDFVLKMPEMHLGFGKLQYEYYCDDASYYYDLPEDSDLYIKETDPDYYPGCNRVLISKLITYHTQLSSITDKVNFNSFMYVPSLVEVDDMSFFDNLRLMTEDASWTMGTKAKQQYCEYILSKCFIYNLGLSNEKSVYEPGDEVVPMFYFNNGTQDLSDSSVFPLIEYKVECYIGYNDNHKYYAKSTYYLVEQLSNGTVRYNYRNGDLVSIKDGFEFLDYDFNTIIKNKEDVGINSVYDVSYNNQGNVIFTRKPGVSDTEFNEWQKIYIDKVLKQLKSTTIRLVVSGKIKTGNGVNDYWEFGGYDVLGNPRIYQDIYISISSTRTGSSELCDMSCDLLEYCATHCKWKQETNRDGYKYNLSPNPTEKANGSEEQNRIVSENVYNGLEALIKKTSQSWNIENNPDILNQIHIYNIRVNNTLEPYIKTKGKNGWWKYEEDKYGVTFDKLSGDDIQTDELIKSYKIFFEEDGSQKITYPNGDTPFEYDFYLMHDSDYWYGVFISKMVVSQRLGSSDIQPIDTIEYTYKRKNPSYDGVKVTVTPIYQFNWLFTKYADLSERLDFQDVIKYDTDEIDCYLCIEVGVSIDGGVTVYWDHEGDENTKGYSSKLTEDMIDKYLVNTDHPFLNISLSGASNVKVEYVKGNDGKYLQNSHFVKVHISFESNEVNTENTDTKYEHSIEISTSDAKHILGSDENPSSSDDNSDAILEISKANGEDSASSVYYTTYTKERELNLEVTSNKDNEYWLNKMMDSIQPDPSTNQYLNPEFITSSFTLEHYRSGQKFLINRMKYVDASPTYHFKSDDLIVATVDNVKFPYILDKTTKWSIKPFSLGMSDVPEITGISNSCLLSVNSTGHSPGYYDVSVRYSVDGNTNQQYTKTARILIE